jgi:isoleucyl-tRNA synthetase
VLSPVTAEGLFDERAGPPLTGLHVLGAGSRAVEAALVEQGALLGVERLVHRYPYDWRTRTPVITRATAQWFVSVDDLLPAARAALDAVRFTPPAGRARLEGALTGRSRWCISRQRAWGVPIPVWFRSDSGEPLLDADVVEHVARIVEERGSDAWWDARDDELLPQRVIDAARAAGFEYTRGMDTLDVWFDSGCASWGAGAALAAQTSAGDGDVQALPPPADLVIEGSDQHRGWFQSSLLLRVAAAGAGAPFRGILTHGFVLDKAGHKMSKSRGNVVVPADAIAKVGVDALRFWVASADSASDVLISDEVLARSADALKKVRNTLRFLLGVLPGVERALAPLPDSPRDDERLSALWALPPSPRLFSAAASAALSPLDACFLARLQTLDAATRDAYDAHSFGTVTHALAAFAARELSAQWCECVKDRLYQDAADDGGGERPRSSRGSRTDAQLIAWEALRVLTRALAPIAPFCAEDIFAASATAVGAPHGEASVFHTEWHALPAAPTSLPVSWAAARALADTSPASLWDTFFNIKSEAAKALEALRVAKVIGAGAEAAVTLALPRSSEDSVIFGALALLGATPGSGPAPGLEELLGVADARVVWDDAAGDAGDSATPQHQQQRAAGSLNGVQYIVIARAASGVKCERCWRVSEDAAKATASPKLCVRCEDVVFPSRA